MKYKIRYNSELYHHGVNGMKWGVRRYQNEDGSLTPEGRVHYGYNSETRQYTKELNRLDRSAVDDRRKYKESQERQAAYRLKRDRIVKKNTKDGVLNINARTGEKLSKLEGKIEAERTQSEFHKKRFNDVEDKIKLLVDEAESKGYRVDSKDVLRLSVTGADVAKSILATTAAGIGANIAGLPISAVFLPGKTVEGKQYKVKTVKDDRPNMSNEDFDKVVKGMNDYGYDAKKQLDGYIKTGDPNYITKKDGIRDKVTGSNIRSVIGQSKRMDAPKNDSNFGPKYTPEQKKAKMERAKKDDTYDLLFLEAIQNSKILYDEDTKAIQKEYSAYLDDPKDYFLNRSKLKQA